MTEFEFWQELRKIKNKFKWVSLPNIRGRVDIIPEHRFCPITALYYSKTGRVVCPKDAVEVGTEMGLGYKFISGVIHSADNDGIYSELLADCLL